MILDLNDKSPNQIYHLMTQTLIPRPIAWVLSDSAVGQDSPNYNLAPFSYFTAVSSAPPLLMCSIGKKPNGDDKDTIVNAKNGSKLVIHIASADQYREVTDSSATLAHGESELENLGVSLAEFEGFDLPRLETCPIAFGCEVYDIQTIGNTPQHLLFAEVKKIYIQDETLIANDQRRITVDATKVAPLSRLGAAQYADLGHVFSQARPK